MNLVKLACRTLTGVIFCVFLKFNGLSSHESSIAQWQSIWTCNRKFIGPTPVGRTRKFFFRVCLHLLKNHRYQETYNMMLNHQVLANHAG